MKIITDTSLASFKAWGGAVSTLNLLTDTQKLHLENYLDSMYPDGITDNDLNDYLWFECDDIAQYFGFKDFDVLMKHNKGLDN